MTPHVGGGEVRVPASTSNLGAGFDTLGMAVRRYLRARYEPGGTDLVLVREGTLADLGVPDADDLLLRAFVAGLEERGIRGAAGTLRVSSEIPVGRGLGTSAAAVVAGLLLAAAAAGDEAPDRVRLLDVAASAEGHGDNAAPALRGGLVAVTPRPGGGVRALPLRLSPDVAFAFAAPSARVSTAEARRVLPERYPRETAVAALGRLAALLYGLAEGDGDALAAGLRDELHVPFRIGLVPGGADAAAAAAGAGAWGATLSGSGSGVIALCPPARLSDVTEAMAGAFRAAGQQGVMAFPLEVEREGGRIVREGGRGHRDPAEAAGA